MPYVQLSIKALRPKEFSDDPQTLGEHLKRRRKTLGLLQREAAIRLGCDHFTYINWEKDKTKPVQSRFRPIIDFLGYDPSPSPATLADRVAAQCRAVGLTRAQVARRLGFDEGTLHRYLKGIWRIPVERRAVIEAFLEERRSTFPAS